MVGTEIVGPVVGEQLKRQGTLATVLALTGSSCIWRCVSAQLRGWRGGRDDPRPARDLAFLQFFGYELTLNSLPHLTITGYSVNDTISSSTACAEHAQHARDNLEHIVNVAVNQRSAAPSSPRARRCSA